MKASILVFAGLLAMMAAGCTTGGAANMAVEEPQYVYVRVIDGPVDRASDMLNASPNDIICKREKIVGSRFNRPVCKTRGYIEAERRSAQDALHRNQERNSHL